MSSKKKMLIIIGLIAFVVSVLIKILGAGGTDDMTALEKYYNENIEPLQIEQKLDDTATALSQAAEEYKQAADQGLEPDWSVLEPKFNDAIQMLESQKNDIDKIAVEDAKVKEVHNYLISSYDSMITGYKELVMGLKSQNADQIQQANDLLVKGQEDAVTWQQMLNEK